MRPDPSPSGTRNNAAALTLMTERSLRKPRALYTRALTRICERLDSQDTHEIFWKDRLLREACCQAEPETCSIQCLSRSGTKSRRRARVTAT